MLSTCRITPLYDFTHLWFFQQRSGLQAFAKDRLAFQKVYEPYERIDTQDYWPVMSYSWNELALSMLWIFTFFSTAIRGPTPCWTFRWSNTDLSRPALNCVIKVLALCSECYYLKRRKILLPLLAKLYMKQRSSFLSTKRSVVWSILFLSPELTTKDQWHSSANVKIIRIKGSKNLWLPHSFRSTKGEKW